MNLIDRFLTRRQISNKEMQLLGVTAMVIAGKYQEIYPPPIEDYIHLSDGACTKDQVVALEAVVLRELDFSVNFPTPNYFLQLFSRAINVTE